MMIKYFVAAFCFCMLVLSGCENTDLQMATNAGMDAVKALTLSDKNVQADCNAGSTGFRPEEHTGAT